MQMHDLRKIQTLATKIIRYYLCSINDYSSIRMDLHVFYISISQATEEPERLPFQTNPTDFTRRGRAWPGIAVFFSAVSGMKPPSHIVRVMQSHTSL